MFLVLLICNTGFYQHRAAKTRRNGGGGHYVFAGAWNWGDDMGSSASVVVLPLLFPPNEKHLLEDISSSL
jgi:hypothetical protein